MMTTDARAAIADLKQMKERIRQSSMKGAKKFGDVEMAESQKLVPVDTGDLKSTGTVHEPTIEGDKISVLLTYGDDSDVDYARHVHEDLEAFHENGQAKYLEQPLNESAPYFSDRVSDFVKKDLGL